MLNTCDGASLIGQRDRALLLLGLASALRRAELAALAVADLSFEDAGVTLSIVRGKTDQEAAKLGRTIHAFIRMRTRYSFLPELSETPLFFSVLPSALATV